MGGVTGLVGAAGGFGGFVPPLLMGYIYGRTESYALGLWLLSIDRSAHAAAHRSPSSVAGQTETQGEE